MGFSGQPEEIRIVVAAEVDRAIAEFQKVAGAVGSSTSGMSGGLDSFAAASQRVEGKVNKMATVVSFSMASMASGTGTASAKILKLLAGMGFAFGTTTGAIVAALGSVALMLNESSKATDQAAKSIEQFQYKSEKAYAVALAAAERYADHLKEEIDNHKDYTGHSSDLIGSLGDRYDAALRKVTALRDALRAFRSEQKAPELNLREIGGPEIDPAEAARFIEMMRHGGALGQIGAEAVGQLAADEAQRAAKETSDAWEASMYAITSAVDASVDKMRQWGREQEERQKEIAQGWERTFNAVPDLAELAFRDVIASGESMRSFWKFFNQELLAALLESAYRGVAGWAAAELAKKNITRASVLERVALESWGAIKTVAVTLWEATTWIAANAAKAAAAAWAAMVGIPFVGPFLAPAVALATLAGVMALGSNLKSAAGGYDIPAGTNPITQLHAQEMVLPKEHADTIRRLGAGGEGGGTYHVYAWDSQSMEDFLRRNGGSIARAAQTGAKRGATDSGIGRRGGRNV